MAYIAVTGDDKLISQLEAFRQKSDLEKAFDDGGKTVAAAARALVPVDSGRLLGSIRVRKSMPTAKVSVQAGSSGFPYAPIVHYGQMPGWSAQPFLTQAVALSNSTIPIIFDKEMDKTMRLTGV